MRDLPLDLKISEFAKRLCFSVDTAKKWLKNNVEFQRLVTIRHTAGGYWRLNIPAGESALRFLKMQVVLQRIFHRKKWSDFSIPRMGGESFLEGWEASLMRHPSDMAGLLAEMTREMPGKDFSAMTDELLEKALPLFLLKRAAFDIQKRGEKVLVSAIAESLGVKVRRLYREPFGASALRTAIRWATGVVPGASEDTKRRRAVVGELSAIKTAHAATKRERNPYYAQRRADYARCYVGWRHRLDESDQSYGAILWLFWEIPRPGMQISGQKRRRWRVQRIFSPVEIAYKLAFEADRGVIMDFEPLANCFRCDNGREYAWLVSGFGPIHKGVTNTFNEAVKAVERCIQPNVTRRRVLIQNPYLDGSYLIPIVQVK